MVCSLEIGQKALNSLANARIFGVTTRTLSHWLSRLKQHDF
ncbi:MAG: hypothetical protein QRY74_04375 [Chlamydia sp.]